RRAVDLPRRLHGGEGPRLRRHLPRLPAREGPPRPRPRREADLRGARRPLRGGDPRRPPAVLTRLRRGHPKVPTPERDCGGRRWNYCAAAGASRTATDVIGRAGGWSPREPKNFWSEKL